MSRGKYGEQRLWLNKKHAGRVETVEGKKAISMRAENCGCSDVWVYIVGPGHAHDAVLLRLARLIKLNDKEPRE